MNRVLAAFIILSVCAESIAAQAISGRVTDSAGAPVPHARVLVHAWGDTTDAALRVAVSNDRGEYHLTLGARGKFVLTAFNIGYKPEPERAVDITDRDAMVDVVMRKLPPLMATVSVSDYACVPLDSPHQSERVRDLVHQIQHLIRSRRAIEREYEYQVHESFDYHSRYFTQRPADSSHVGEIPPHHKMTDGPIALSQNLDYWAWPNEGLVITPFFTSGSFCFDTTLSRAGRNEIVIRFRNVRGQDPRSGALRVTDAGMLTEIRYETLQSALTYTPVTIDGETFPFITRAVTGGYNAALRGFSYSKFVRIPPRQPPPAPTSAAGRRRNRQMWM